MKRHPALQSLSSDHHQGLVQARRLVQAAAAPGDPVTADRAARAFLVFWAEHTHPHFREEEEVLLPAFARYGDPTAVPVMRMLSEHGQIRRLVAALAQQIVAGPPDPATLAALGELLRARIRYEEEVLFPLIERTLPEAAPAQLPQQFAAFS